MLQSKKMVIENLGKPDKNSDSEIFFYNFYSFGFFKKTISIIFDDDQVIDIMLTEYIFGFELCNTYYFETRTPHYRTDYLF